MKKWAPLFVQSLVSVTLLAWIFWKEDFRTRTWHVLTSADPGWLTAGFLAAGAGNLLGVVRWAIFLRVLGIRLPAWDVLRLSFVGLFFNNFLVGAVGGDAVKVVWLAAKGHGKTAALLSVLMDRMSGFGALVLCSLIFMLSRLDWLMGSAVVAGLIKGVFIYLVAVVALTAFSFLMSAKGLTSRLPRRFPGREMIIKFTEAYFQFVTAWRQTLIASILSVAMLLAYFLTFYFSARAFGLQVPVEEFFAFMPAVDIISALPISLGGFGVREQLFATVLGESVGRSRCASGVHFAGRRVAVVDLGVVRPGLVAGLSSGHWETGQGMNSPLREASARYRQWPNLYYYAIGKIALDPAYPAVASILRGSQRPLLDLGCGMGLLAAYLRANGHRAPILGLDVDERKIDVAQQVLGGTRQEFHAGDAMNFPDHCGDIVMLDVLHYFSDEDQQLLLKKIAASIAPRGVALIRLALNESNWRFAATKFEEWFVHFSRWISKCGWNFPTRDEVLSPFNEEGLAGDVRPMWGLTPFNSHLFTFRRKD